MEFIYRNMDTTVNYIYSNWPRECDVIAYDGHSLSRPLHTKKMFAWNACSNRALEQKKNKKNKPAHLFLFDDLP